MMKHNTNDEKLYYAFKYFLFTRKYLAFSCLLICIYFHSQTILYNHGEMCLQNGAELYIEQGTSADDQNQIVFFVENSKIISGLDNISAFHISIKQKNNSYFKNNGKNNINKKSLVALAKNIANNSTSIAIKKKQKSSTRNFFSSTTNKHFTTKNYGNGCAIISTNNTHTDTAILVKLYYRKNKGTARNTLVNKQYFSPIFCNIFTYNYKQRGPPLSLVNLN